MTKGHSNPLNAYKQVAVETGVSSASPHRLIQMLIDAALEKISIAKGLIKNNKIAEKGKQIGLAVAIIDGLKASLDKSHDLELANNLESLYEYMMRRLTQANISNDVEILEEVASLLKPIKEAWDSIPEEIRKKHAEQQSLEDSGQERAATG